LAASYIIIHIATSLAVVIYERPRSLREASKFVLLPLCQPILPWVRKIVPGFTICSAEFSRITDAKGKQRANNLKTLLSAIATLLCQKQLLVIILGL